MNRLTLKNLLGKGYFCEELPPPFTSEIFAANLRKVRGIISKLTIAEQKKLSETDFVRYSIPKVGIQRRTNGIPNPFHQYKLSELIYLKRNEINIHFKKKNLSASIPEVDLVGNRAVIQFKKYERFKEKCIEVSFDSFFELRTDISKYFPSIYTHSIPWALHGKAVAKRRRRDRTLYGNVIDENLRFGQSGQTIGIPIGTDTSRIIAEIIGCAIDQLLISELRKENIQLKGYRFVDDCHFFFYNQEDAEKAFKHFRRILNAFSLNIKEEKTAINKAPFQFENDWQYQITNFKIRYASELQRIDIRNYYNLLIRLSKIHPSDSVIKYGIKRFQKLKVHSTNWTLYESLFYSLTVSEGAILPDLLLILLQNRTSVTLPKLKSLIQSLLSQHIYKGNHFEVSWTLWIARSFKIRIPLHLSNLIAESRDMVSFLILLDLRNQKLTPKRINLTNISLELNSDGLTNDHWLVVYEAAHKGWLSSTHLSQVTFFSDLSKSNIYFYDDKNQLAFGESNISPRVLKKKRVYAGLQAPSTY